MLQPFQIINSDSGLNGDINKYFNEVRSDYERKTNSTNNESIYWWKILHSSNALWNHRSREYSSRQPLSNTFNQEKTTTNILVSLVFVVWEMRNKNLFEGNVSVTQAVKRFEDLTEEFLASHVKKRGDRGLLSWMTIIGMLRGMAGYWSMWMQRLKIGRMRWLWWLETTTIKCCLWQPSCFMIFLQSWLN